MPQNPNPNKGFDNRTFLLGIAMTNGMDEKGTGCKNRGTKEKSGRVYPTGPNLLPT